MNCSAGVCSAVLLLYLSAFGFKAGFCVAEAETQTLTPRCWDYKTNLDLPVLLNTSPKAWGRGMDR